MIDLRMTTKITKNKDGCSSGEEAGGWDKTSLCLDKVADDSYCLTGLLLPHLPCASTEIRKSRRP